MVVRKENVLVLRRCMWTTFWETCVQVKKQQLEPNMEQQIGSKLQKEYGKVLYCHPAYLTSMQSTSCEMMGWMKQSWNQDCREKYLPPHKCRWHHSNGRKQRGTKEPLDEGERGEWKCWLKTQHSKNEDHGIWFHHFMANRRGESGSSDRLLFSWALKSLQTVAAAMKLKDAPCKESYDKPRQCIKRQRHHFDNKGVYKSKLWFFQ